jgi:hypothetical protein
MFVFSDPRLIDPAASALPPAGTTARMVNHKSKSVFVPDRNSVNLISFFKKTKVHLISFLKKKISQFDFET